MKQGQLLEKQSIDKMFVFISLSSPNKASD